MYINTTKILTSISIGESQTTRQCIRQKVQCDREKGTHWDVKEGEGVGLLEKLKKQGY